MKSLKIILTSTLITATLCGCSLFTPQNSEEITIEPVEESFDLSESEAKAIAEKTCIKGGESLAPGNYNEYTKTWWFDANLNTEKEGCNPACVVSEKTKTAEINWRCTGLIPPSEEKSSDEKSASETIRQIFVEKYPNYAETLSVHIDQETENHARGGVIFQADAPGGIFLATKIGDEWRIVFDGNGQISCDLAEYGFPDEMLSDCSDE
jgi:hypothetical protein